jgi:ABC-2 type transport system permease protein
VATEKVPGWAGQAWAETIIQLKVFSRTAVAAFFTVVMPLAFLIIFNLFEIGPTDGEISAAQFITPSLAVFAMVTATFTNLAIGTAIARDSGILKRVYASPMPISAHVAGRIFAATIVGLASVILMLAIGVVLYGVTIIWAQLPVFLLLILLGAATFSALGLAVAMVTPSAKAAPAVANAFILPLVFISGVFFPLEAAPEWLQTIAKLLPLAPLVEAAIDQFIPGTDPGFPWAAVVSLVVWGLVGTILATRLFRWEPASPMRRSPRKARGDRKESPLPAEAP